MSDSSSKGRFVWYDLATTDPGAAIEFYGPLVGWGTQLWDGPKPYTMWTNGEAPIGGVIDLPEAAAKAGAPPHWISYIDTPDVDATCAEAEQLGGKVVHPGQDIPEVGRFAVLADPQGAVFAVYKSAIEAPGCDEPPQKGEFSWHELMTTDYTGAFDFYQKLFGWDKLDAMDMGELGIYQMYGRGEMPLGGMFNKTPDMPVPPNWLYYVLVDDVNTAVEKVKESGGQVLNGPMEVPGGDLVAQCMDPQGAAFALHSQKKA